jgi:phosphatidylglycerophosphatase A
VTLAKLVAGGLGTGFVPVSPGTAGSLLALLLGAPLLAGPSWLLPSVAAAAALVGLWAIAASHVQGDPGWVVIDEVAGQWLAMAGLARVSVAGLVAAFLVFRLLDIAKPGPIGWADRQPGAAGIMADDLIAGGLTAGILWAVRSRWPELLA